MMSQMRDTFLSLFALGHVFGNSEDILRSAVLPENRHLLGPQDARADLWRLDRHFAEVGQGAGLQNFAITIGKKLSLFAGKQVLNALSDHLLARHAEHGLSTSVEQYVTLIARVLHHHQRRHVLDHCMEERSRAG